MDDQPIPIPKPPRLFNDTLIRIEDTTTTTTPALSLSLSLSVYYRYILPSVPFRVSNSYYFPFGHF